MAAVTPVRVDVGDDRGIAPGSSQQPENRRSRIPYGLSSVTVPHRAWFKASILKTVVRAEAGIHSPSALANYFVRSDAAGLLRFFRMQFTSCQYCSFILVSRLVNTRG
jgi:hypothetical protein